MMKQQETIASYLFYAILLVLFLPTLQLFFGFKIVEKLNGVSVPTSNPTWSYEAWMEGNYQMQKDFFWKENFGYREDAIRLNNDRIYHLYKASSNKEIIIGKDNYLFERVYINEYCGLDYVGKESIKDAVAKLKVIQDKFKKLGKTFVVIIAPSKARYYSEYLPDYFVKSNITNYSVYLDEIKEQGLNVLDFNACFEAIKDTVSYPLFPQTGTHWSDYGVTYFVDSLLKYLDVVMQKDVPDMVLTKMTISDKTLDADRDIEKLLNLSTPFTTKPHAYTKIKYNKEGKYRPSVLAIGDSFYGSFYFGKPPLEDVFASSSYWFYYNHLYPENRKREKKDLIETLNKKDLVILIGTTAALQGLGWGAISGLYEYVGMTEEDFINLMKIEILNSPDWYRAVAQKAKNNNIPVDSMLYLDAVYMINEQRKK